MATLKLKILHKYGLRRLLNSAYVGGGLSLEMLIIAQKVIGKVNVSSEDEKAVDMIRLPNGNSRWSDKKDVFKDVDFSGDEIKLIKEIVEGKSKSKKLSSNDLFLVDLLVGLGLEKIETVKPEPKVK